MLSYLPLNQVCSTEACELGGLSTYPLTEKASTPSLLCYTGLSCHKGTGLVEVPWLLLQSMLCDKSGVGRSLPTVSGTMGMRGGTGKDLGPSYIPASLAVPSAVTNGKGSEDRVSDWLSALHRASLRFAFQAHTSWLHPGFLNSAMETPRLAGGKNASEPLPSHP